MEVQGINQLTQYLVKDILEIESTQHIAVFAGSFKIPTYGHFSVVKKALEQNPNINRFYIYVGSGTRDGVTQEQSVKIWNIYEKYLPVKVEVIPVGSPITAIYDYAKAHPDEKILWVLGAREGNIKDIEDAKIRTKSSVKYPNLTPQIITTKGDVSGTKARQALKVSQEEFTKFIPNEVKEKDEIYYILKPELKETIEPWIIDLPKFNPPITLHGELHSQLYEMKVNEITLNPNNAVEVKGNLEKGEFKVGDIDYIYSIDKFNNPYKDEGLFYNIQFDEKDNKFSPNEPTKRAKENFIKILSTMYKIILDFVESKKPEYIGISHMEKSGYGNIYNKLTKQNKIPGYSRKDAHLNFKNDKGENGAFIVLKKVENMKEDKIPGGLAKNKSLSDIAIYHDKKGYYHPADMLLSLEKQLNKGIKVEMEHTIDPKIAKEIAMDHLWEDPNYYDKLDKIEKPKLNENKNLNGDYKKYLSYINEILTYCCNDLQIERPKVVIINDDKYTQENHSFGGYQPGANKIYLVIKNRNLSDCGRTICHETFHCFQDQQGVLTNESGKDGSQHENECNAYAGKIMREFNRKYPEILTLINV